MLLSHGQDWFYILVYPNGNNRILFHCGLVDVSLTALLREANTSAIYANTGYCILFDWATAPVVRMSAVRSVAEKRHHRLCLTLPVSPIISMFFFHYN